jgi:hypothetical protein
MDLTKIGLFGLAGFGAYALYEQMTKKADATSSFTGTNWQTKAYGGTDWQNANLNFNGTDWQQAGANRETNWQTGNVFSNAAGGVTQRDVEVARRADSDPLWMAYARTGKRSIRPIQADPKTYPMSTRSVQGGHQIMNSPGWRRGEVSPTKGGGYTNASGTHRANLQGTDWQTENMSNACGSCGS